MVPRSLRRAAARLFGERNFGVGQCLRHALRGELSEDAGFNGQPGRQRMFVEIVQAMRFDEIVETGTFRGDTAAFMAARSGLPVATCESSPRHYAYARTRFTLDRKVRVAHSDSRTFLRAHFGSRDRAGRAAFAYLDAHWGADLPLYDETRILLAHPATVVVMIDDFQVPDDPGYAFDSYGAAATLNLAYLRLAEVPEVRAFFPVLPSSGEGGARRGCVVLAKAGPAEAALRSVGSLRAWGGS